MRLKSALVTPSNAVGPRLPLPIHQHQARHLRAHDDALVGRGGYRKLANQLFDRGYDAVRIKLNSKGIWEADRFGERHTPNLLQLRGVKIENCSLNKGCTEINPYESQNKLLSLAIRPEILVRISDFLESGLEVRRQSDGRATGKSGGVIGQIQQQAVRDRMFVYMFDDGV